MDLRPLVFVLVTPLLACSTGSGGGAPLAGSDYCGQLSARAARCDAGAVDPERCARTQRCLDQALRPGVKDGLSRCIVERACGENDDGCVAAAAQPYADGAIFASYAKACTERREACKPSGKSFDDDFCESIYAVFSDGNIGKLQTCLGRDCAEISGCLRSVLTEAGCD
jgi:hypothetical protein